MLKIPGRIPIVIQPFFLLIVVIMGLWHGFTILETAVWLAVVVISILFHELGHALTAFAFRQKVSIELTGLGGVTYHRGPRLRFWQEFLIVINGPFMGFLLFIVAYKLRKSLGETNSLLVLGLQMAQFVNLFWNLINLLPITPLDGGRLLNILMEAFFGVRGARWSFVAGTFFAVALGLFFLSQHILFPGLIMIMLAYESYRSYCEIRDFTNEDREGETIDSYQEAKVALEVGDYALAYKLFERLSRELKQGRIYVYSIFYMAEILNIWGEAKKAYDLLLPIQASLPREFLELLHSLAYRFKNFFLVIELGDLCYEESPSHEIAFKNAVAYACLGEVKPSIGWLQCTISEGMQNLFERVRGEEFDKIREDSLFQNFIKILKKTT